MTKFLIGILTGIILTGLLAVIVGLNFGDAAALKVKEAMLMDAVIQTAELESAIMTTHIGALGDHADLLRGARVELDEGDLVAPEVRGDEKVAVVEGEKLGGEAVAEVGGDHRAEGVGLLLGLQALLQRRAGRRPGDLPPSSSPHRRLVSRLFLPAFLPF